nr:unnamed protein product [Digitaria exilis]
MLHRVAPSLRRALVSSAASSRHGRAEFSNPSHPPPQALLPHWRRHASAASSSAPPPPPPPQSPPRGPSRSGGGGPSVSSLNPAEVAKFAAIAETWRDPYSSKPLEGLKVIDVGCGGGILSEPLARMGATVTAIDAVGKNIKIASIHAVIEHVANPLEFCESLSALTVPNGATVVSTINRSMRAYATAIVAAEYILRWLPKGTHEWSKLVTPEELALMLQKASVSVEEMAGFVYNPLTGEWSLSDDISVNYIAFGVKKSKTPSPIDGTESRLS